MLILNLAIPNSCTYACPCVCLQKIGVLQFVNVEGLNTNEDQSFFSFRPIFLVLPNLSMKNISLKHTTWTIDFILFCFKYITKCYLTGDGAVAKSFFLLVT